MKKLIKLACVLASVVMFGACSDTDETGTVVNFSSSVNGTSVLEAYANDVVITRYEGLADAAQALYEAVVAIESGNESEKIGLAATAWKAARKEWERTEAYLFGPVDSYSIDPKIDSWPLDLESMAGAISTEDYTVITNNNDCRGFHCIEYLLFVQGEAKTSLTGATAFIELTNAENETVVGGTTLTSLQALSFAKVKDYLVAVTENLFKQTVILYAEWVDYNGDATAALTTQINAYCTIGGFTVDTSGGYVADFTSAGIDEESSFSATTDALSLILESAAGIASEVGELKIGDPYSSGDPLDVESWFSYNSLTDFTDNIIGIKEAYYGTIFAGDASAYTSTLDLNASSIGAYVQDASETLHLAITSAIETAISAIQAIGTYGGQDIPFRDAINDTNEVTNIENAMTACAALEEALVVAQEAVNEGYYIE